MYEIRWPQRRWINLGQISQWYELATQKGNIREDDLNLTISHDMVKALERAGCLVLTGASK